VWEIIDEKGRTEAHIGWADKLPDQSAGELDARRSDWAAGMTLAVESGGDGLPVTTLTGTVDQAALQSVLRRSLSLVSMQMIC
jgi:hypothetical protein